MLSLRTTTLSTLVSSNSVLVSLSVSPVLLLASRLVLSVMLVSVELLNNPDSSSA